VTDNPVFICDPGIDDMLALMVLVGSSRPPVAVVATAGNCSAEQAYRNTVSIMALLGLDVPVGIGAAQGLAAPYPDMGDPYYGDDGIGLISSELPLVASESRDGLPLIEGAVLATCPMTALAIAFEHEQPVTKVMWMGGAVADGGNMTPTAEFNAWMDPEAADEILASELPLTMIPLDITRQVSLTEDDLATLSNKGEPAQLASKACRYLQRYGEVVVHDATAAVAWVDRELFRWEERWVRCEVAGAYCRGTTVVDRRPHGRAGSTEVAVSVDVLRVKERIMDALKSF
jgi:purine nucleosidase